MKRMKMVALLMMTTAIHSAYSQENKTVRFSNPDSSIIFGGTLSTPAGRDSHPAVILLSGTGKQDRNGTMGGHAVFKVLADSLTRLGFAVLRTDDRGVGATTGRYETATTKDFAEDALAAVDFLRTQPGIARIGLIGHSEGGAAAIIAASMCDKVAFVVTLAGLATKGLDALKLQNANLVNAAPIDAYDKQRHNMIDNLMFDTAYCYAYTPELAVKLQHTYENWKHADDSAYAKDKPGQPDHMRFFIDTYIRQATGPWYQYHIRYDPVPFLEKIKVPFLALNGDKDLMVPYQQNLATIKNTLLQSGNTQVTVQVLPGLNHLFLQCNTCTMAEIPQLKEDFSAAAWQVMKDWLKRFL